MMGRNPYGVTSQRCVRIKRNGEQCARWAIRGGKVCTSHGGYLPVVQKKAAERVALAEALAMTGRRHPGEVLLDVVHALDVLMNDARSIVTASESVTAEEIARFVEATERAGRFAKLAIDADVATTLARVARVQGADVVRVLNAALGAVDLTREQEQAMREAMARELRALGEESDQSRARRGELVTSRMDDARRHPSTLEGEVVS